MCNFGVLTAVALLLLAPCANALAAEPAEPPITEPMSLIDTLTAENVTKLLTELGAQKIETRDMTGGKLITFFDGPVPYNMGIALCDIRPGKCLALSMGVIMDPGSTSYTLETLNKYNTENMFVTAIKLEGNKVGFGRVWLVDGGVTKKNMAINIASFIVTFRQALKEIQPQVVAGVQTEGAFKPTAQTRAPTFLLADPKDMERITKALVHKTTLGDKR
jgi:hypothetical protein